MKLQSTSIVPLLCAAALGMLALQGAALATAAIPASAEPQATSLTIEGQRDAWLAETELTLGANPDGSWIGFGSATIDSAPSPKWGSARVAAFERAEAEARASFVEMTGVQVTTESVSKLFQDDDAFAELLSAKGEQRSSTLRQIEEKLAALDGEELILALEVLGLGALDLAAMDEPQKRVALAESFKTRVATRAARQLRGLRVIQTFEARGAETYSIGVLVRWSEKNAKLAEIIRTGQGSISSASAGRPLEHWIPKEDEALLRDWGVRVFPGPKGEPIVVCFSQVACGLRPEDPPRAREAKRRSALMRAKSLALRDLTQFINATTVVDQLSTSGETYEVSMELFPDGFADHDTGSSAIEATLERSIKTRGEAVITGGEVARSWRAVLPGSEAEFCGVVYAWSPTRARLAFDFAAGKSPTKGEAEDDEKSSGNDYPVDF